VKRDNSRLNHLLARGNLGGPKHDEILREVLRRTDAATAKPVRGWMRRAILTGAALASAVALWLIVARPPHSRFSAKGSAREGAVTTAMDIGCGDAGRKICHVGDNLLFAVNTAVAYGYLGAYAERAADPKPRRLWYFPTAKGDTPVIPRGDGTMMLPQGIQIGPEHQPGSYRVTVWISDRPLARSQVDTVAARMFRARSMFIVRVTD
jgi:hypothetical protein